MCESIFNDRGHGANGAVTAHCETTTDLDKKDCDITVGARRRIQNRSGHQIMAARLVHKRRSHPVELTFEMGAPLDHARAAKCRRAATHYSDGIAAGMGVDAEERMVHMDMRGQRW